jgi:hypothetical protein
MKNQILVFASTMLLISLTSKPASGQVKDIIFSDLTNQKNIDIPKTPFDFGSMVGLKIKNINMFTHKVEVIGKSFEQKTNMPTELQAIFRQTPSETKKNNTTEEESKAGEKTSEAITKMEVLKNNAPPALQAKLASVVTDCKNFSAAQAALLSSIARIKSVRLSLINLAKTSDAAQTIDLSSGNYKIDDMATINRLFDALRTTYFAVEGRYEDAKMTSESITNLAASGTPARSTATSNQSMIKDASDNIEAAYEEFKIEDVIMLMNDCETLKSELGKEKNFQFETLPIQASGDIVRLEVKIIPEKVSDLGAIKHEQNIVFEVPVKGGTKFDFGVGPTFSFGNSSRSQSFYMERGTTDTSLGTLKKNKNQNLFMPAIAATIHCYKRTDKNIGWGAMFGVGAGFETISDADLTLYLGVTAVLGKSEKLMLSAGVCGRNVDRLKTDQFKENSSYKMTGFNTNDVTQKVMLPSFFFGLSYSLTNRVEVK